MIPSEAYLRIHTVGASGSGTTTLAVALAAKLGCPHFDSDDYYWEQTDPPFTTKRLEPERLRRLQKDLAPHQSWLLSGSLVRWGDLLVPAFTHVVFLSLPPETRLARLQERERRRFGSRIEPGGDMHQIHCDLMDWAARYDQGGPEVRSRKLHEDWFQKLRCPLVRIDGLQPTERQVEQVLRAVGGKDEFSPGFR